MSKPSQHTTFQKAISHFLKGYFRFSGRATRSEFNYALLFYLIVSAILAAPISCSNSDVAYVAVIIWQIFTFFPFLALWVRRGHDISVDTLASVIVFFVPFANIAILLGFMAFDSDKGKNEYGNSEKYPEETNKELPQKNCDETVSSVVSSIAAECPFCGNKINKISAVCPYCGGKQSNI